MPNVLDNQIRLIFKSFWETDLTIKHTLLIGVAAYIVGFAIDPLGRSIRYNISHNLWETPIRAQDGMELTDSERYTLIKQFCEGIYTQIETWDMLKGMAANCTVGTIILIIIGLFKLHFVSDGYICEWWLLISMSTAFTSLLLYQAHYFEKFSVNDMTAAIKSLGLAEKAKKIQG